MAFNPSSMSRVLVRATNWLGDAVMSLPAIRAIRGVFPHAHLAVLARPSVADLYARETAIDRVIRLSGDEGLGRPARVCRPPARRSASTARSCCRTPSTPR